MSVSENEYAVEMLHITKRFPGIVANDDITIQLKKGEIHALLGENGAGKSTLMSVLFGMYHPEEGSIRVHGKEAVINVYPEKNKHKRYIIILSFTDKDEILSIAGKIKLTE